MNPFLTLLRREWMQSRLGWTLMALVPTVLGLLLLGFGQINLSERDPSEPLPLILALAATTAGAGIHLAMLAITAIIMVAGLARRDHADRSVEFWLSMPVGHAQSLAVPLLVHLILVPVASIAVGLLSGLVLSWVVVARVESAAAWLSLPWSLMLPAMLSVGIRVAFGLVLAVLWLSPLILLAVLLTAWFRRWGLVILALGLGLGSQVLHHALDQPMLSDLLRMLFTEAGQALFAASVEGLRAQSSPHDVAGMLSLVPAWAGADAVQALSRAVSPGFAGAILAAAACFALLVQWRRGGAGAAS